MVVYLALVFGIGIVLEDVSKNVTSQRDSLWGFGEIINDHALDSDSAIRLRSLFKVESFSESKIELNKVPIFDEIMKLRKKESKESDIINNHLEKLNLILGIQTTQKVINGEQKTFILVEGSENIKDLMRSVNGIYYSSKNSVYRDPQYYAELSEIQSRIDFTGALTFLCVVFFLVYLAFGFSKVILSIKYYGFDQQLDWKNTLKTIFCLRVLGILLVSLVFLFGIKVVGMAYQSEFTNFNLRVFGYYVSQKLDK
jgi:hypothetical protein